MTSTASPSIRPATEADAPGLAALVQSAYRGIASRAGWTTEADLLDGDRIGVDEVAELTTAPGSLLLVVDDEEGPLACCNVQDRGDGLAYFGLFAVRPGAQGGGIGRTVLAEAERRAVEAFGARTLEMTVLTFRGELIAWYERRGYERTGEERPFPAAALAHAKRDDLRFAVLRKELDHLGLATLHARHSEKWTGHDPDVLVSTIAEMDLPLAPPVAAALHAAIDRHDLGYAPPAPASLREAFAAWAQRRLGWTVDPGQVTTVPDVMTGLVELIRVMTVPGEAIAFATPAYPPFLTEFGEAGVQPLEVALRADGSLDLDALDGILAGGARVLVLSNPHNPTGRALPRTELEAIAELCAAHGAWVLADEIHAPLVLDGAAHTSWHEVSAAARERSVVLTSASKAFNLAGLKTAFAVTASVHARELVARLPADLPARCGLLGHVAAEAAFREGDAWLDGVLRLLGENRALLGERLAAELPGVVWTPPQATYLAWLDCRALALGDDPAATFLERGRVALSPGLDYGFPGAGHVRLNFGTSPELVAEAVARMARAID